MTPTLFPVKLMTPGLNILGNFRLNQTFYTYSKSMSYIHTVFVLQSETSSCHKSKKTQSEPKQSLIRADLKPGLACFKNYSKITHESPKGKS